MASSQGIVLFVFSFAALFIIACYPWAHAVGNSRTYSSSEHFISLTNTTTCSLRPTNESGSYLSEYFDDPDNFFVFLNIQLDGKNPVNTSADEDVILPMRWIWAYGEGLDYLRWPREFFIWRLLFRSSNAIEEKPVILSAFPPNCALTYGETETTVMVVSALGDVALNYLKPKERHYSESNWCYIRTVKNARAHTLVRNFGTFIGDLGYRCCQVFQNRTVKCHDQSRTPFSFYVYLPFYMSFILLLISPIILSVVHYWISKSISIGSFCHNGYESINDKEDQWYFLGDMSPVTISSVIMTLIEKVTGNKIKIVIFVFKCLTCVLVFPICIYIRLAIYKHSEYVYMFLLAKIEHNLPVGFSAMLFDFHKQSINFLTLTGGPTVMFVVFSAIVVLFLTLDHRTEYDDAVKKDVEQAVCLDEVSSDDMFFIIKDNSKRTIRADCWKKALGEQSKCKILLNILSIVSFNLIPLVFAFRLLLVRVIRLMEKMFENRNKRFFLCEIVAGIMCCYLLYGYCAIFIASVEFLLLVTLFMFTEMLTDPDVFGGYIALVFGLTFIIFRSLRYPAHKYMRLLDLTVDTLKKTCNVQTVCTIDKDVLKLIFYDPKRIKQYSRIAREDSDHCEIIKNTLVFSSANEINSFWINGTNVNLVNDQVIEGRSAKPCLRYEYGRLGVNRDLFNYLTKVLKPVWHVMLITVSKTILSTSLLILVGHFVKEMHLEAHIGTIANVLTVYILVQLPAMLVIIARDSSPEIRKFCLRERIMYETVKYHENCENSNNK